MSARKGCPYLHSSSRQETADVIHFFSQNTKGRDFAVGDIHGHFSGLRRALAGVEFNPAQDRLFSVGDLVDRGQESENSLEWLDYPWFHAVRGNHEDYAIRHGLTGRVNVESYRANGGAWLIDMQKDQQKIFALAFNRLPFAIEVETRYGKVGIIHADCPVYDWKLLAFALRSKRMRDRAIWSRTRISDGYQGMVQNIHAVIVGHTPLQHVTVLGNVIHIDTGGWAEQGRFTLLDLNGITPQTFHSESNVLPR